MLFFSIMRIVEMKLVPKNKRGIFHKNSIKLEHYEEKTARLLTFYGFNVEVIRPTNTPKMNNPDILMTGTMWEIKTPINYNKNTLKNRMKKASKQANQVIFDLRNVKNHEKAQKYIIELFRGNRRIRRMIIITKDKKVLDLRKK